MAVTLFPSVAKPNTSAQRGHVTTTSGVSKTNSITPASDYLLLADGSSAFLTMTGDNLLLMV